MTNDTESKPGLDARIRQYLASLNEGSEGHTFDLMRSYGTGQIVVTRSDKELPMATCQSLPKAEQLLRGILLARD